ncbi:unnamed protein product [Paramecium pentaurelia]|uniref:non-specific serine/threonine protein kinase n=1 Tax=Paramecium pentaurelia TaxID=43138 RepID=A0A8S1VHT9_9CILI|nr:unnamed protein product [Paramecium pentaurelia]
MDQSQNKYKQYNDYQIIATLGKGQFGLVKLGERNGQRVAIKFFLRNDDNPYTIRMFANEINILKQLDHPNITNMIDFNQAFPYKKQNGKIEQQICIILEYAENGELYEYIARFGKLNPEICRFYFKQLLSVLIYITNKGICHRDLKLDNILLDQQFNLKVADFGLGKVQEAALLKTYCGSQSYMAPEITKNHEYNGNKADIFSAGVILFILYTGSPPFESTFANDSLFQYFENNRQNEFWIKQKRIYQKIPDLITDDFISLINGMLAPNPNQRFTLDQCMQHPWTNGPTATLEQIQNEFRQKKNIVQIQTQHQVNRNIDLQTPIGDFRCSSEQRIQKDYSDIIEKYQLTFANRVLIKSIDIVLTNEFVLYQDPKIIFCQIIKKIMEFQPNEMKIHESKYKINVEISDENLKFSVQILNCDNKMFKVKFINQLGNYIQFKLMISRIRDNLLQMNQ